jgi:hypothetical protein
MSFFISSLLPFVACGPQYGDKPGISSEEAPNHMRKIPQIRAYKASLRYKQRP